MLIIVLLLLSGADPGFGKGSSSGSLGMEVLHLGPGAKPPGRRFGGTSPHEAGDILQFILQ